MAIDVTQLADGDVGRGVVYRQPGPPHRHEDGVITSWNDRYVFVWYGVQTQSQATPPETLTFLSGDRHAEIE